MSKTYFAGVAEQWDTLRASMFGEGVRSAALEQAVLFPQAVAVDVGAGTRFIAQGLAPRVAQVHVVDYSPEMLVVAAAQSGRVLQRRVPPGRVKCCSACDSREGYEEQARHRHRAADRQKIE